ncbi:MAG: hypothetical protein J7599_07500 [Niabella sp.]|nr:hypothetical protein [Niabella sp.]
MAQVIKISDLSQKFSVEHPVQVELPDGNVQTVWQNRFDTVGLVKAQNTTQQYTTGMDAKDVYYNLFFRFHKNRAINISDRVKWDDKILHPVGDCSINDFGDKRFFKQLLKYVSA